MTLGEASDNLQDNTLPRVLLIGDSISLGYTNDVCEMLKGIANVYRPRSIVCIQPMLQKTLRIG
jgi:hypothetical protein